MKNITILAWLLVFLFAAISPSCTLITNFDDRPDGGDEVLYSLATNVDDPIEVELLGDDIAVITLSLDEALPDRGDDDSVLQQLLSSVVTLTVENLNGGATVDLTQGTLVQNAPTNAGEYRISINGERDQISIEFYNQIQDGRSLRPSGNYEAKVEILENKYLVAEVFSRDITVLSGQ